MAVLDDSVALYDVAHLALFEASQLGGSAFDRLAQSAEELASLGVRDLAQQRAVGARGPEIGRPCAAACGQP